MVTYRDSIGMNDDIDDYPIIKLARNIMENYFQKTFSLSHEEAHECVGDYINLGRNVIPMIMKRKGKDYDHMKKNDILVLTDGEPFLTMFSDEDMISTYGIIWESIASMRKNCPEDETRMLDDKMTKLNDPSNFIRNYFPEYAD